MDTHKLNRYLVTFDRWCGYVLFFLILLYFLTGIGQTKDIIGHAEAKYLHETCLPVPTFFAFLCHGLISIRFILLRKGVKDITWWSIYLLITGTALFCAFLYLYIR